MNKYLSCILKLLACLASWLTISPLFYYLAKRWGLMKKWLRIVLLCISPLFLLLYFFIFLISIFGYIEYDKNHKFDNRGTIEQMVGVSLPKYKITNRDVGEFSFRGEYSATLDIEFKEIPSADFYASLDSIVKIEDSNWRKNGDCYTYSCMWGNGLPAPNGQDDTEDLSFSLDICKGNKQAIISYGAW